MMIIEQMYQHKNSRSILDENQSVMLLTRGQGDIVVATKIQAGMIHAGQTVTVAADGQFRLVTGGKTVTVVLRTTTSGIHMLPGGVRFWEWNGMGAAGRRQPRSEAVTVPGRMPLTCRNVVQQRVADVRALFGTKRPTMDTGIATYGVPGSGQKDGSGSTRVCRSWARRPGGRWQLRCGR
jgi:hypothetical protein